MDNVVVIEEDSLGDERDERNLVADEPVRGDRCVR